MIITQILVFLLTFYICSRIFKKKKISLPYERPNNLCEICNGTGNALSPRSAHIKAKMKCLACKGEGILRK